MKKDHEEHGHHHDYSNIKIATFLNVGFTIIEFVGGALTNSLAILADALHDLGDSLVLISTWKAESISVRKPDWRRTFGYRRFSLLAAFLNAVILLGGSVIILFQVIGRLVNPQPVHVTGMIVIALVGIVANAIGSLRLKRGESLIEKVLSWHLLEDVLSWAGILIAAIAIRFTGWYVLDPIITIGFTGFVLWGVWKNSKELINVFLEGAPSKLSVATIAQEIEDVEGVKNIYDIHLWSLDGKHHIATLKALVIPGKDREEIVKKIKEVFLKHRVTHSTIQLDGQEHPLTTEKEQGFL